MPYRLLWHTHTHTHTYPIKRVCIVFITFITVIDVRADDGKPIRDFVGVQKQPHRDVVERLGRRRGTESETVRGTRRDHISILRCVRFPYLCPS